MNDTISGIGRHPPSRRTFFVVLSAFRPQISPMKIRFRSLVAAAAWTGLAAIVLVTVGPISLRPTDLLPANVDRMLAFGLLASLYVVAYPRHWVLVGVGIVVGAGVIELLQ
jgi:hypothetical protein